MKKKNQAEVPIASPKETPTCNFHFSKGEKTPEEMASLSLGEVVTVTVKGKVKGISQNEWGSSFEVSRDKLSLKCEKEKPKSMKEAVDEVAEKRKA